MGNLFNAIFNGGERAMVAGWQARDERRAAAKRDAELMDLRRREVKALEEVAASSRGLRDENAATKG